MQLLFCNEIDTTDLSLIFTELQLSKIGLRSCFPTFVCAIKLLLVLILRGFIFILYEARILYLKTNKIKFDYIIPIIKYGLESHRTHTREGLRWWGQAEIVNYRPVLSSERASWNKPATVYGKFQVEREISYGPWLWPDTRADCRS
jgi:hypothetical protein